MAIKTKNADLLVKNALKTLTDTVAALESAVTIYDDESKAKRAQSARLLREASDAETRSTEALTVAGKIRALITA